MPQPDTTKPNSKIIITDIHGQLDAFELLLAKLPDWVTSKDIVLGGDYVDRGSKNKDVMKKIIKEGYDAVKGNHDDMMCAGHRFSNRHWFHTVNGGSVTDKEYENDEDLFEKHQDFLRALPTYREYPEIKNKEGRHLVVSHSSIGYHWENRDSDWSAEQIMWGRDIPPADVPEIFNVFGHTPQGPKPLIGEHFACIDGGGFCTWDPTQGKLFALQFPEMIVYEQKVTDTSHADRLREAGYDL